jgi:hypothetical protein
LLRVVALAAAVLGGLCWLARWAAEVVLGEVAWSGTAHLGGLVLLGVAVAGVGAGLVSSSAAWLRLVVAIAAPLLAWSVYSVVRGDGDGVTLDGFVGLLALVVAVAALLRGRGAEREPAPRRRRGSHSAR